MQITSYLSSADETIDTCNEAFWTTADPDMTDQSSKLASFNGERKDWKTWKKQRSGYKIINEEEFEATKAFQTRGRETESPSSTKQEQKIQQEQKKATRCEWRAS